MAIVAKVTLRKKYPYSELFCSALFRIRTECRQIRSIQSEFSPNSVRIRKNSEKMWTRITPNTDTFYAVESRFKVFRISPFSFFNISFNLTIVHSSERVVSFIDKCIIFLKGRANTSARPLRNFAEISSGFTGIEAKQNLFNNLFRYVEVSILILLNISQSKGNQTMKLG